MNRTYNNTSQNKEEFAYGWFIAISNKPWNIPLLNITLPFTPGTASTPQSLSIQSMQTEHESSFGRTRDMTWLW
jgi:hypothetical protein